MLADIFTNFGGIVSGPVAFLVLIPFNRELILETSALGISKFPVAQQLFLICMILGWFSNL